MPTPHEKDAPLEFGCPYCNRLFPEFKRILSCSAGQCPLCSATITVNLARDVAKIMQTQTKPDAE